MCKDGVKKGKTHLEFNLARGTEGFYRYIRRKRKNEGKYGSTAEQGRGPGDKGNGKAISTQYLNCFWFCLYDLPSGITDIRDQWEILEQRRHNSVVEDKVREHLHKLDANESMGLDGIHE